VQGLHSAGREYGYIGRPIWDTPRGKLPWFNDADIGEAIDIAEAIMKKHGLETRRAVKAASGAKDIYDLTPDMVMTLSDGEQIRLDKLEQDLDGYQFYSARNGGSVRHAVGSDIEHREPGQGADGPDRAGAARFQGGDQPSLEGPRTAAG